MIKLNQLLDSFFSSVSISSEHFFITFIRQRPMTWITIRISLKTNKNEKSSPPWLLFYAAKTMFSLLYSNSTSYTFFRCRRGRDHSGQPLAGR